MEYDADSGFTAGHLTESWFSFQMHMSQQGIWHSCSINASWHKGNCADDASMDCQTHQHTHLQTKQLQFQSGPTKCSLQPMYNSKQMLSCWITATMANQIGLITSYTILPHLRFCKVALSRPLGLPTATQLYVSSADSAGPWAQAPQVSSQPVGSKLLGRVPASPAWWSI